MRYVLAGIASILLSVAVYMSLKQLKLPFRRMAVDRLMTFTEEEKERREEITLERPVTAKEFIIPALAGFTVFSLAIFFIPPIIAFAIGCVIAFFAFDFMRRRKRRYLEEIQDSMPILLMRFAENLRVRANVEEALAGALETLANRNILRVYLEALLKKRREKEHSILLEAAKEVYRQSPELSSFLVALYHLWEVGGPGFGEAFQNFATFQASAVEQKRIAMGKARGAEKAVAIVAGSLMIVFTGMLFTPALRSIISRPFVQLIYALLLGMMAFGWNFMNGMVEEATK